MREAFSNYWDVERDKALVQLANSEGLDNEGLSTVIKDYLFTEKAPLPTRVVGIMETRPNLPKRLTIVNRVIEKIKEFVETFYDGVD